MTMGRYEEVRDRATEVMTQQAMANAAMQAGKIGEALDYATAGADIAEKILKEYEDIGASYVVYCNATGFRFQLLDAIKDYQNAFFAAFVAIYTTCPYLAKRLDEEHFCCLFATQLTQMFVSFRDFVEYKGYLEQDDEVGQKAYETIDLMFQITYNAFDLLKLVAPDNRMVAPMSNILKQMEEAGFERYDDCKDLNWQACLERVYDNLVSMKIIDE